MLVYHCPPLIPVGSFLFLFSSPPPRAKRGQPNQIALRFFNLRATPLEQILQIKSMDRARFELATPTLQMWCSTN